MRGGRSARNAPASVVEHHGAARSEGRQETAGGHGAESIADPAVDPFAVGRGTPPALAKRWDSGLRTTWGVRVDVVDQLADEALVPAAGFELIAQGPGPGRTLSAADPPPPRRVRGGHPPLEGPVLHVLRSGAQQQVRGRLQGGVHAQGHIAPVQGRLLLDRFQPPWTVAKANR